MRISLLAQREPWLEIAVDTLARYWTANSGREHRVHAGSDGEQVWYCNPYLNAIFVRDADRAVFEPARREFSHSLSRVRRPLQKAYVSLATGRFATLFTNETLSVTPAIDRARAQLIVAGNNKLRILDRAAGTSVSIVKSGFDRAWLQREISARAIAVEAGVPVPELVASGDSWLTERYVGGTPLNRLPQKGRQEAVTARAMAALEPLHDATSSTLTGSEYVAGLVNAIEGSASALVANGAAAMRDEVVRLARILASRLSGDFSVETVLAHGDFQPANILVDGETFWIIDWENSTRRQRVYDRLVMTVASRFPSGLANRLGAWLDAAADREEPQERVARLRTANLFLLEELESVTRENANARFLAVGPSLHLVTREAAAFAGGTA